MQPEAGETKGKQQGRRHAVKQPHQPVIEQHGNGEREQGKPEPEQGVMIVNLIDQAIEQPGIGRQGEGQHELIPEIAALAAIEGVGPRQQHSSQQQGAVGLAGQLLEGEKQEKKQEQGGNPAHQSQHKTARPVRLGVAGHLPVHHIGLL